MSALCESSTRRAEQNENRMKLREERSMGKSGHL
jgi:hypothetical protein